LNDLIDTIATIAGYVPIIVAVIALMIMIGCAVGNAGHWAIYLGGIITMVICAAFFLQALDIIQIWPFEWYGLDGAVEPPVIA
jgi:hypothetical protein